MARALNNTRALNAALVLSCLVVIAPVLPYARIFGQTVTGYETGDGQIIMVLGAVAVAASLTMRFDRMRSTAARLTLSVLGAIVAAVGLYDIVKVWDTSESERRDQASVYG